MPIMERVQYNIHTNARIYVRLKTDPRYTVSCSVWDDFLAIALNDNELPKGLQSPRNASNLRLFLSMQAFTVFGLQHTSNNIIYPAGTFFFATPTKTGGVTRAEKEVEEQPVEEWVQNQLI